MTPALLLLSSHLLTIGFDISGVAPESLFAWPSHVLTIAVILLVGIGSALPLRLDNAIRCVVGTLVVFFLVGARRFRVH